MAGRIAIVAAEAAADAVLSQLHGMTDIDVEYLGRVVEQAQGIGYDAAPINPYGGEGRKPPHTFTGSHGTMGPIDVGDESEVPSAQPDPPEREFERLLSGMYLEPEPGRQASTSDIDDGNGVVASAEPPLVAGPIVGNGLDAGSESGGGVGMTADAAGMWATDSGVVGATEETPATQVYADDLLAIDVDVANDVASDADSEHSVGGSDAGSSTSTAASTGDVTYSPKLSDPLIPMCGKCWACV